MKIKVFGRVQGVGFRYFALRAAGKHEIVGYVRNEPDGSVEILATGEEGNLENFLALIGRGPSHARIDRVSTSPLPLEHFERFQIEY